MREIVKLGLAAAIIVIAAVLIGLFASGYLSAFKPGGAKDQAGEHVVGGSNTIAGGGVSAISTPAPSPLPQPGQGMPETMPVPPGPEPPAPTIMPIQTPVMPPVAGAPGSMENPIMEPVLTPGVPGQAPNLPMPVPPSLQPPATGPNPVIGMPGLPVSSGQPGWLQTTNWLLRLMPLLFPGIFPGWTWWK